MDTGARPALMLTTPFIKENDILKAVGPTTDAIVGTGIGGETVGSVGRVKYVTIGGLTSANPPVHLPTEPAGALDDKSILGIIGGGVWRGYVFTVDYPNSRFLLRPIPGARIPEYDMSGIALITTFEDRHKFTVNRVAKGSPAEEAGIKKGDVITTIDGNRHLGPPSGFGTSSRSADARSSLRWSAMVRSRTRRSLSAHSFRPTEGLPRRDTLRRVQSTATLKSGINQPGGRDCAFLHEFLRTVLRACLFDPKRSPASSKRSYPTSAATWPSRASVPYFRSETALRASMDSATA